MSISSPRMPEIDGQLYVPAAKVYPRPVSGIMRRRKTLLASGLMALTAIGPWLRWDRGPDLPDQALLFSFPQMRAYLFGAELWAQDFYFLVAVLVVAALGLFLATSLYGRIWCGFACPQTVWTDLFVGIERWAEGDSYHRQKLDHGPWTWDKVRRKGIKHLAWLVVSALTGATFTFYFTDAIQATLDVLSGQASTMLYGFFGGFAAMTYLMAGWGREQFCVYMCPWPRIQGGMLDERTKQVGYDRKRGEARGHAKAGRSFEGRGHCVDCGICVQVCPVGIDIRDGAQMDCIACGLCADGCDGVMRHFGLPTGLVGWQGVGQSWRSRPLIYGGLMVLVLLVGVIGYGFRPTLSLTVLPDRSPSAMRLADGSSRDGYTLRVVNQRHHSVNAVLGLSGLEGGQMSVQGQDNPVLAVGPDRVETFRVWVRLPSDQGHDGAQVIKFLLHPDDGTAVIQTKSVFLR